MCRTFFQRKAYFFTTKERGETIRGVSFIDLKIVKIKIKKKGRSQFSQHL